MKAKRRWQRNVNVPDYRSRVSVSLHHPPVRYHSSCVFLGTRTYRERAKSLSAETESTASRLPLLPSTHPTPAPSSCKSAASDWITVYPRLSWMCVVRRYVRRSRRFTGRHLWSWNEATWRYHSGTYHRCDVSQASHGVHRLNFCRLLPVAGSQTNQPPYLGNWSFIKYIRMAGTIERPAMRAVDGGPLRCPEVGVHTTPRRPRAGGESVG